MTRHSTIAFLAVVLLLLSCHHGYAKEFNNKRALAHLAAVKVFFDVKTKNPDKLALQLGQISETMQQLAKAGVKAEIIIGFRSQASNFVTKGDDYVLEEELEAKKEIQAWVQRFHALGVFMEQCLLSATLQDIDPDDFLPGIEVVKNSYISMIAYQARGYSQVTME